MKKWMIGVFIGLGAIAVGAGGAFAYNAVHPIQAVTSGTTLNQDQFQGMGPGRQGRNPGQQQGQDQNALPGNRGRNGFPGGMMGGNFAPSINNNAPRITFDEAYAQAQTNVSALGSNFKISEVMEFERNFYVVVTESDSGRGAMELLVDPYTGKVSREIGPGRMWNLKYAFMGMTANRAATDNTLPIEAARTAAQTSLDNAGRNATLNEGGFSFYGYYSFDYSINGQIAGMLSVNGLTGQVRFHNWHGTFISEKEY